MPVLIPSFRNPTRQSCLAQGPMLSFGKAGTVRGMGRGTKADAESVPMELRKVIAENINRYIPQEIETKVAELGDFNQKTITRLRYPDSYPKHGVTVGSLVKLSNGLQL